MDTRKQSLLPKLPFLWKGLGVGLCFLLLLSCKPQVPSEYLSPGEMEDILYDYHLAIAIAQTQNPSGNHVIEDQAYKMAVLDKYGVTEQQFEESMQYYMRHTERLHDIYGELAERLSDEALAHGASASQISQYGSMSEKGDTTDVWAGMRAMVFSPQAPFNSTAFYLKADTSYHRGDRLELHFDAQYIVQEGNRGAMAVMMVKFLNDSIASQMQHVNSNSHYMLTLADAGRFGIKEVRGYIMMTNDAMQPTKSLKLLCITNIHLVKMHVKEQDVSSTDMQPADSLSEEGEIVRPPVSAGGSMMPVPAQRPDRLEPPPGKRPDRLEPPSGKRPERMELPSGKRPAINKEIKRPVSAGAPIKPEMLKR